MENENLVKSRILSIENKLLENKLNSNIRKEEEKQEKIKSNNIVSKWLQLQKIIKEEITLREIIKNQKEENQKQLKENYKKFFESKLQLRQISENINSINNNLDSEKEKEKEFILYDNPEEILQDAYDPIKKLFNLFRSNYDYVVKLISIIGDNEELINNKNSSSIIDLFCHQFYDNILIPNPEQEELLILIYLLLEKEINEMNSATIASFLDDNYSILGKFLKSYTKKQELKTYLSNTLGSLILSIENLGETCLDLNLTNIKNTIEKNKKKVNKKNKQTNITSYQLNDLNEINLKCRMPKCRIDVNKRRDELELDSDDDDINNNKNEYNDLINDNISNSISESSSRKMSTDTNTNDDYNYDINQNNLNERISRETNKDLKQFFLRQLERINKDPNIYTNLKFYNSISELNDKNEILEIYKKNFLRIQKYIDQIIQTLIDKISAIPYPLKCICKIINMLIQRKFPKISTYERNGFIGEFIFSKCILPILINSDHNAIITSTILSQATRNCLITIAKVLTKINRGMFFESNLDTESTIFNHYIIEVIPIINEFYERLIDIQLPKILDQLIEEHMKIPNISIIKKTHMRQANYENLFNNKSNATQQNPISLSYDYFSQNPDELINIQCMCFSLDDILFILDVIKENKEDFNYLEKYNFFAKTIDKISNEEAKLDLENRKNPKEKKFIIIYNINEIENNILKDNENINYSKLENDQDSIFILKRIIFCIKTVLSGLNLLNEKDYPYLNNATTTGKFFSALKYTLEDYGESPDGKKNEIPLKWYSQYISNNKKMLEQNLKENDYEKLYQNLYSKEDSILKNLKNYSSELNTRNGLNKRCAEKIIEKSKIDLSRMKVIEKFMNIESFIKKSKFELIIQVDDCKIAKSKSQIFDKIKNQKNEKINLPTIIIHNELKQFSYLNRMVQGDTKKNEYAIRNIKDFIKQFSDNPWINNEKKYKLPKDIVLEDIIKGNQNNKIAETFQELLNVIQKYLEKDKKFDKEKENEYVYILESIENHIQKNIYSYVFPKKPLKEDNEFYNQTIKLSWITPENLDIKKIFVNELKSAQILLKEMNEKRTCYEKLNCISEIYNTINNTIKFSTGKNDDAGADDLAPIFQYIIIKSKPERFFSNINFIKCFIRPVKIKGIYGFLLTQLEFAAEFINNIDHTKVKLSEEEFKKNIQKSLEKFNKR
jgi:hypothetical protein